MESVLSDGTIAFLFNSLSGKKWIFCIFLKKPVLKERTQYSCAAETMLEKPTPIFGHAEGIISELLKATKDEPTSPKKTNIFRHPEFIHADAKKY
jgi:hypothetical protein